MKEPFVTEESLPAKTSEWRGRLESFIYRRSKPDPEKTALLVIDMQRYFLEPESSGYTPGGPPILGNIKRLIEIFHSKEQPVIYTTHAHRNLKVDGGMMAEWWGEHIMEGTPEAEIYPGIAPDPNDKVVTKQRYSAFYSTDLESALRCLEITDIIITGVMTNLCCESTARDAFFRDFRVFFPIDANGAVNEEFHISALINLAYGFAYITETEELLDQLR